MSGGEAKRERRRRLTQAVIGRRAQLHDVGEVVGKLLAEEI